MFIFEHKACLLCFIRIAYRQKLFNNKMLTKSKRELPYELPFMKLKL